MEHLPWSVFDQRVTRYGGDKYAKAFTCSDRYRSMAFAQLTNRTSLRDIEMCLRTQATKLYHMGIRGEILRTTIASANQSHDSLVLGFRGIDGNRFFRPRFQCEARHPALIAVRA